MNQDLLEALHQAGHLADLTDEDIARLATLGDDVADEELASLDAALIDAARAVDLNNPTDDDLALLDAVDTATQEIRASVETRDAAANVRRERVAALAASINGTAPAEPELTMADRIRAAGHGAPRSQRPAGQRVIAASGRELADSQALAVEFIERHRLLLGGEGPTERVTVASAVSGVPHDERLGDYPAFNMPLIRAGLAAAAAMTPQTIAAAGGLCGPPEPIYAVPMLADTRRPVRDALLNFPSRRGRVTFSPPLRMGDATAAVGNWTIANDVLPGSDGPATKPILELTCPSFENAEVQAITRRVRFGNFMAQFNSENVDAWLGQTMAEHARLAEDELLATIKAGSTAVAGAQLFGATRDLLAHVEHLVTAYRYRFRLARNATVQTLLPEWVIPLMRTDVSRQAPGDDELNTTDAEIEGWFHTRGVAPSFYADDVPDEFIEQGIGPINGWPTSVEWGLWHAGAWGFLDGGELNLGLVRDSVLNSTNRVEFFAETFEGAALFGLESLWVTSDVCPDGSTSAPIDASPCATGS